MRLWPPNFPFAPAQRPFFYGWAILAAATLGIISSVPGRTIGFSVFTDILMEELGLTRLQRSGAYLPGTGASGFLLSKAGGQPPARVISARFCRFSFGGKFHFKSRPGQPGYFMNGNVAD